MEAKKIVVKKKLSFKNRKKSRKKAGSAETKNKDTATVETETKTKAELAFEKAQIDMENDRIKKAIQKTYREKVEALNKHLATLTEHNDIPRVGPG